MLAKLNVRYVIVGHSERRQLFGETDEMVNRKLKRRAEARDDADRVCRRDARGARSRAPPPSASRSQTQAAFAGRQGGRSGRRACVAYEPIWAIGTGRNATPDDAERRRSASIRAALRDLYGDDDRGGRPHPVRRQREAREHRRPHGDARDRRRARRRGVARPRRLRPHRPVPPLIRRAGTLGTSRAALKPGESTHDAQYGPSSSSTCSSRCC